MLTCLYPDWSGKEGKSLVSSQGLRWWNIFRFYNYRIRHVQKIRSTSSTKLNDVTHCVKLLIIREMQSAAIRQCCPPPTHSNVYTKNRRVSLVIMPAHCSRQAKGLFAMENSEVLLQEIINGTTTGTQQLPWAHIQRYESRLSNILAN